MKFNCLKKLTYVHQIPMSGDLSSEQKKRNLPVFIHQVDDFCPTIQKSAGNMNLKIKQTEEPNQHTCKKSKRRGSIRNKKTQPQ